MFGHPIVWNGAVTTDDWISEQRRQLLSIRVVAVVAGGLAGQIDGHGSRAEASERLRSAGAAPSSG